MKNLIVIPAYNEEEALPRTVAALDKLPPEYELLVVNDGSRDRTGTVADRLARQPAAAVRRPPVDEFRYRGGGPDRLPVRGAARGIRLRHPVRRRRAAPGRGHPRPGARVPGEGSRPVRRLALPDAQRRRLPLDVRPPHRHPLLRPADRPAVGVADHRPDERLPLRGAAPPGGASPGVTPTTTRSPSRCSGAPATASGSASWPWKCASGKAVLRRSANSASCTTW